MTANGRRSRVTSETWNRSEITRARLAAIVTSSADAIIGETLDGTITDWNPAAERLYGHSASEAIGQPLSILAPPDRTGEIAELLERVCRGESVTELETVRRTKSGRLIDVCLTISPVRDDAGQIIAASSTTRDITERKAAEAALAHERDLLRVLMDSSPDAIYFKDRVGRFTCVNLASARLYGLDDPQAAVGKTDFDFYPEKQARGFWSDERPVLEKGSP